MSAMNLPVVKSVPPEVMSPRARRYLGIAAARNGVIGLSILITPQTFSSPGFDSLRKIAPLWLWGVLMVVGFTHLTYATASGKEWHARAALIIGGAVSIMWAVGWAIVMQRGYASIVGVATFGAIGLKDLNNVAQPLRAPFEPLIRLYNGEASGHQDRRFETPGVTQGWPTGEKG